MDKICIKNLEIFAFHGVLPEEKENGQSFFVSADLFFSLKEAASNDNLAKTIDYAAVCMDIRKVFTLQKYNLIERCADQVALHLLEKYPRLSEAHITVRKPQAPIENPPEFVECTLKRKRHTVYLGLGSNLGDRERRLKTAISELSQLARIEKTSAFLNTAPVGMVDQPDFLNAVVKLTTTLEPLELLDALLEIELKLGRVRKKRWGARTIDLDILLFDEQIISEEYLAVPHPRMHEREFVLVPLCEIAPNALHPLLNKRVSTLFAELTKTSEKTALK